MFELVNDNIENWKETEFWVSDPMQQNRSLQRIILWVDWEDKIAYVETEMKSNSYPMSLYNGICSSFTIPEDTDFVRFEEYYDENIRPLLQKLVEHFEVYWDGSNHKGKFENIDEREYFSEIEDFLLEVDKHDLYYYFDIRDSFCQYSEIIDYLSYEGIDFMKADLDNDEILKSIISALDDNIIILNHSNEDYRFELKEMQESLKEEMEE